MSCALFVSFHAPHSADKSAAMSWWQSFFFLQEYQRVIQMIPARVPQVVFMDANARSPPPDNYHVGAFGHISPSQTSG
eukprot:12419824-Karenia_brevis.AAC.1